MINEIEIGREEFFELSSEDIRRIVSEKGKPRVGIFIADGNRRLVMCRTRLSPTSDEFYKEYARFFVDSLKESLEIFFSHGLHTLFFPLFGPSLLRRTNKFQSISIPIAYRKIFESDEWLQFYKENGIRVKAYGDLSQLEKIDVNHLNMAEGIMKTIEKTALQDKHTLFFGFMAENTPGLEMPQLIVDFYTTNNRLPGPQEMIEMYYGEAIPPADFIIASDKISGGGALPPFINAQKTKVYFFPVPGFLAFKNKTYKKILFDLLFLHSNRSVPEYMESDPKNIEALNDFYHRYKSLIIGTSEKVGDFWVPALFENVK